MFNNKPDNRTIAALKKRFAAAGNTPHQTQSEPAVQKNLRLPESAAKLLAVMAKAEGLSQAAVIVKLLDLYAARSNAKE